jgi:CheY-like chemotaxis protein
MTDLPTILLVEDDRDDEELTRIALGESRVNNRLVVVRDGAEALDYLFCEGKFASRDPRDRPALVLLDLNLPKLGGVEVLTRMRQDDRTRDQPVVVFTSSKEEHDLMATYALGANSYVQKPVDATEFGEAVKQLGLYWGLLNEPPPATPASSSAHDAVDAPPHRR